MEVVKKLENLYNYCTPIEQLECDTVDYKIFKNNPHIRFCSIKDLIKYTPVGSDDRINAFCGFVHDNPYFWMIPLMTSDLKIFGFILKSYFKKSYRNVFCNKHICSFYGFHKFKDFKYGMPIILSEGSKDCIALQRIYRHSLACLTSGLGIDDVKAISRLTNKVLLCYDNDEAGKKATQRDLESLSKLGCKVIGIKYLSKDPGETLLNPTNYEILKNSVTTNLLSLS